MTRLVSLISALFITMTANNLSGLEPDELSGTEELIISDTVNVNQFLYNGHIWNNLFTRVEGNQFLFSKAFMKGSVTVRGKTFTGVKILYDIFRDEILIPYNPVGIIQLNKEMVDSFSVSYDNRIHLFERITQNIDGEQGGYYEVIFTGKTKLYARFEKKIEKLADGGKYDKFYLITRIYLSDNGAFHHVTGKKDFVLLFGEKGKEIRRFIKDNRLKPNRSEPDSFIPVLKFADSINGHIDTK